MDIDQPASLAGRDGRRRLQADERRQQIVAAAFAMIAQSGFENLRTRDVADRVGINSATLHHYFPTKEALIEAVAGHLESLYRDLSSPIVPGVGLPTALQRLRQEFSDAGFLRRQRPDMLAVSAEFLVQAHRDRTAARAILSMHRKWREQVEAIIRDGKTTGVFSKGIDPTAASMIVVGALWGATGLLRIRDGDFAVMCDELQAWLTGKPLGTSAGAIP